MPLSQEQFNAIIYWDIQSFLALTNQDNDARMAAHRIANDQFNLALHGPLGSLYCYFFSNAEYSTKYYTVTQSNKILGTTEEYKNHIIECVNRYFNARFDYTMNENIRPNLLMHFIEVHGLTTGTGLAIILLTNALSPSPIPIGLGVVAGVMINNYSAWDQERYVLPIVFKLFIIMALFNTPGFIFSVLSSTLGGYMLNESISENFGWNFSHLPNNTI